MTNSRLPEYRKILAAFKGSLVRPLQQGKGDNVDYTDKVDDLPDMVVKTADDLKKTFESDMMVSLPWKSKPRKIMIGDYGELGEALSDFRTAFCKAIKMEQLYHTEAWNGFVEDGMAQKIISAYDKFLAIPFISKHLEMHDERHKIQNKQQLSPAANLVRSDGFKVTVINEVNRSKNDSPIEVEKVEPKKNWHKQ